MSVRKRLARWMRRTADCLDPLSFTTSSGEGFSGLTFVLREHLDLTRAQYETSKKQGAAMTAAMSDLLVDRDLGNWRKGDAA